MMNSTHSSLNDLRLKKLVKMYERKCSQLKRAKSHENFLMTAIYQAEADLLRSELEKL